MLHQADTFCPLCRFTFQSGYIPIGNPSDNILCIDALHSNLVIFQSLQNVTSFPKSLHFTFQSGYIPIQLVKLKPHLVLLYIPIWLYSNQAGYEERAAFILFTFQSGYIPIPVRLYKKVNEEPLHSNLVIFQCMVTTVNGTKKGHSLHSNLVIFQ